MLAHGQGMILNASRLTDSLQISAHTVRRYIDLLADLLLVRRLAPFHNNLGKRLVKSPKIYIRDSGLVHALLNLESYNDLAGHAVLGSSWGGFVIENLIAAAPWRTFASFYRTLAGAEIDLLLELPGAALWAIEIKRSLSARPEKGFHIACEDLKPDRRFVVNAGFDRYPIDKNTTAIGLPELARMLWEMRI
jgi:predicted AAA+ superfamily ATPase